MTSSLRFGLRNPRPVGTLHWSNLRLAFGLQRTAPPPFAVDYLKYLPRSLGMMLNDQAGDCFWAAQYHGRQLRTLMTTGVMDSQPDAVVGHSYSAGAGWDGTPGDASDRGTDAGEGFAWITKNGLPLSDGRFATLRAAIEVDPRHPEDCVDAMDVCGGLCVGMQLPQRIVAGGSIPKVWDWESGDIFADEGHEVLVGAMDSQLVSPIGFVSWGDPGYTMTEGFWNRCVNQVTAVVYDDWFKAGTQRSPLGMTEEQLVAELARYGSGGGIP